ncbi:hypothetical protein [Parabacteroides sp. PF5-9]|uniref:hypothetical protein n=1 Tax=Parabacteroides sp. PF5-9 TaxID=1742404 RepID=UPI0024770710|nr:hypothetical protein [Parabacteroides sp. PF5-9]MDH6356975.1 hypothetical protein [Parabacteroides sp. PF5-9]
MPRRKKITIKAKDTAIFGQLIEELSKDLELAADYDMDSIEITITKKYQPYIQDVDKAISNLQHYYAANGNFIEKFNGKPIISKYLLAKMMKVSRPTVDQWIEKGFISQYVIPGINITSFDLDDVIEQLRKQKQ